MHTQAIPKVMRRTSTVQPIKEYIKPANQVRLSEAELDEDLACSLSSGNPNAPSNIARFVQKDSAFKASPHLSLTSVSHLYVPIRFPHALKSADNVCDWHA